MNSYQNGRRSQQSLTLLIAALEGRILLVTAGFIAGITSTIRLIQLIHKAMRNQPLNGTLDPNLWITVGVWTSFAGGIMALVGDYKRVQPSRRIPIQ